MRNRNDYYGSDYSRNQSGSSDYGRSSRNQNRDWTDRAGDEVRSWFGDDDADRRRRMDDRRDYGNNYSSDTHGNASFNRSNVYTDGSFNRGDYSSGRGSNYGSHETSGRSDRFYNSGVNYDNSRHDTPSYDPRTNIYGSPGNGNSGYDQTFGRTDYGRSDRGTSHLDWDNRSRRDRDWTERTGDEVRSWFGDDDAERRRRNDEFRNNSRDWDRNRYNRW